MQLVCRDAFLARRHQIKAERPFGQRKMARLHYRAGHYGESTMTGIAVNQAGTVRPAIEAVNSLGFAAVRAKRTVRPVKSLEMLPRFGFVGENRKGQVHGGLSDATESALVATYVKDIIAAASAHCATFAIRIAARIAR